MIEDVTMLLNSILQTTEYIISKGSPWGIFMDFMENLHTPLTISKILSV
jgi:hypothetical protein